MHLHHLEDGLTLECRRRLVSALRHDGNRPCVRDAVAGDISDTVDGTRCFSANADLMDSCHNFWNLVNVLDAVN